MAKKQTRRAVSLSEKTYAQLKVYAINANTSMSAALERIIEAFFKGEAPPSVKGGTTPPGDSGNIRFL